MSSSKPTVTNLIFEHFANIIISHLRKFAFLLSHVIKYIIIYICRLTGQYVGCYEDKKVRIMESKLFVDKKNTIRNCINRCKKMGKKYAGMEVRAK